MNVSHKCRRYGLLDLPSIKSVTLNQNTNLASAVNIDCENDRIAVLRGDLVSGVYKMQANKDFTELYNIESNGLQNNLSYPEINIEKDDIDLLDKSCEDIKSIVCIDKQRNNI